MTSLCTAELPRPTALVLLLSALVACTEPTVEPGRTAPDRLRLLALGDSITQADSEHVSYRYRLWELLAESGTRVDFVGSQRGHFEGTPDYPDPDFDADHEGHWGWTADELLGKLPGWLTNFYTPDVVLLHIGTNDVASHDPAEVTLREIGALVAALRADNPAVAVFVAQIIPTNYEKLNPAIALLNRGIADLASGLDTETSPVVVVDQWTGFDPATDTYDGVHPNEVGEQKMAHRFFAALVQAGVVHDGPAAASPVAD